MFSIAQMNSVAWRCVVAGGIEPSSHFAAGNPRSADEPEAIADLGAVMPGL